MSGDTQTITKRKHVTALVMANLPVRKRKRKPTLKDLSQLIRESHATAVAFGVQARMSASVAIECAVICGGYLREAKAATGPDGQRIVRHGDFTKWVKSECGVEPRTARNYMRLHIWVCSHQTEILNAKPRSLRQFYILAGILPEDEKEKLPKGSNDDLAKLRRLVRKVTSEASAHRDYADARKLWHALEPLASLLRDVSTDTSIPRYGEAQ